MTFQRTHIRGRLTLWYVGIFGGLLTVYVLAATALQYWQLLDQLYRAEVQDMETVQGLLYFEADGQLSLHEDYFNRPQSRLLLDRMMEVLDSNGNVLFRNGKLDGYSLGGTPSLQEGASGFSPREMRLADGIHVLAISHHHSIGGTPLLIRLAYSTEPLRLRSIQLLGLLGLIMPIVLVIAGFAGFRMAGKALEPLDQMAELTEQITARRLNERIPINNRDDELDHMARVLNGLLERLEESFQRLQRFTSDVSHEIRTPLAAIRSVGEVALQQNQDIEKYRDIIGSMLEEVARLTSIIDTLLTIAHADSDLIELHRAVFPLVELVQESIAVVGVLAEEKKQLLTLDGTNDARILADRSFLRMAVVNLLDNAVKYSPAGSAIRLSMNPVAATSEHGRFVELAIQDEGPGIPESARQRVFDRFYRLDEARARDAGGVGLGLSIAKWAVEANGGEINVKSGQTRGAIFCIKLPIASENGD